MKYCVLILLATAFFPLRAQTDLDFNDRVYDKLIRTVQVYPDGGLAQDILAPAAILLGQTNLVLEFDDLRSDRSNYYVKLIHCNYDWTKSSLMDLDFLHDYNEYTINDYAFSGNTFQPYVHYRFAVPPVKIPGNYLLVAYRDDISHLILSKRILVYSPQITISIDRQNTGSSPLNFTRQPLNFVLDYSRVEVLNPLDNLHVVIRQNQRWDNAKFDVKASFLRDADSQIEFRFFDSEKTFAGGNEFRFVDFRSLNNPGQNTGSLNKTVKPYRLTVAYDQPRIEQAYAQYNDNDGGYVVDNLDAGDGKTDANYIPVSFTLKADPVADPVYVVGAFNSYGRYPENKMVYSTDTGAYLATLLLKQGSYNYQFIVDSKSLPANYFEGDHFETENLYEILVYNHSFQPNADVLIGYLVLTLNGR